MKHTFKILICLFYYKVKCLLSKLIPFSLFETHNPGEIMQSGELIITGQDQVEIVLKRKPSDVIVKFKHIHHNIVPCNPHHHDDLEWEIDRVHRHHHHQEVYVLIIKWNTSSVREIVWTVCY